MKTLLATVDPALRYTGLVKEICMTTGKVGWIKNDPSVKKSYHEHHGERMKIVAGKLM